VCVCATIITGYGTPRKTPGRRPSERNLYILIPTIIKYVCYNFFHWFGETRLRRRDRPRINVSSSSCFERQPCVKIETE